MSETTAETKRRIIRQMRCRCRVPWGNQVLDREPMTDEELIACAGERGRITAGGDDE